MCFFGGGSGKHESSTYLIEQQQREAQRKQMSEASVAAINQNFAPGSRDQIYQGIYDANYGVMKTDLDRQYGDVLDQIKVNLARSGGLGSASDPYMKTRAQQLYNENLGKLSGRADAFKQQAMADDQRLRGSLISQAWGGLNAGDANQIAMSNLSSNARNYLSNANQASIGDVFSSLANQVGRGRQFAGETAARNALGDDQYTSYFSPGSGYGGSVGK